MISKNILERLVYRNEIEDDFFYSKQVITEIDNVSLRKSQNKIYI